MFWKRGANSHMGEKQGVDSHSFWYPLVFTMRTKYLFKKHPTFNVGELVMDDDGIKP
jgi:hypothetical protein